MSSLAAMQHEQDERSVVRQYSRCGKGERCKKEQTELRCRRPSPIKYSRRVSHSLERAGYARPAAFVFFCSICANSPGSGLGLGLQGSPHCLFGVQKHVNCNQKPQEIIWAIAWAPIFHTSFLAEGSRAVRVWGGEGLEELVGFGGCWRFWVCRKMKKALNPRKH